MKAVNLCPFVGVDLNLCPTVQYGRQAERTLTNKQTTTMPGVSVATPACSVTRSLKLRHVDRGQYLDGRPPGKTVRREPVSVRRC